MDRIALDLGFIQIYWYSIMIFLGMITACFVIFKEAKKKNANLDFLTNLAFYTIIVGVIGARAYFVLFNLDYYLSHPVEILQVWNGGLAIHGGILAGLIFMAYYCHKHKQNMLNNIDLIAPGLIIAQSIGRWGNFFNGEAYGGITTYKELISAGIPKFIVNNMYILGEYRQPTFFYESVWCLFGFIALLMIRKFKYTRRGQITGMYLIWYGTVRILIEELRSDSLMLGYIKVAQLVSLIFIFVGMFLFMRYMGDKHDKPEYKY